MNAGDLLTPWMILAAVLIPLVYVEKWIHSHLYGVGWLLTNDDRSATTLYYVLLFPGIFLHEVVQWLVAGAINVDIKSVRVWPEPQNDGTLRLDFVQINHTNRISAALIGAAPLIVGLALIGVISNYVLNLDDLLSALGTGDLRMISSAIQTLGSKPDFYLWLYLMFAISNAMLPTPSDRQGWPLLLVLFGGVIVFLIIIGTGDQLLETYRESVVVGLERLTTAFATVLVIEIPAILVIGFSEEVLERTTQRKFQYKPPVEIKPRQPGSSEPLPPGEPRPSIYLLELPIPLPPDKPKPRPAAQRQRPSMRPAGPTATPAPTSASPRRADQADTSPQRPGVRPAASPGTAPSSPTPDRTQSPRPADSPARSDDSGLRRRPSQPRPTGDISRRSASSGRPTTGQDPTGAAPSTPPPAGRTPQRASQRPAFDASRRRPSQPRSQDEPESNAARRRSERPLRPAGSSPHPSRPSERTQRPQRDEQSPSDPARPARPTLERPSVRPSVRPAVPRQPSDSARRMRPAPRPDADDQSAERTPFARPTSSRPTGSPRRDRLTATGEDDQATRPPRSTSPFVTDADDQDDDGDLEYIPFDDVEIPDDDDL